MAPAHRTREHQLHRMRSFGTNSACTLVVAYAIPKGESCLSCCHAGLVPFYAHQDGAHTGLCGGFATSGNSSIPVRPLTEQLQACPGQAPFTAPPAASPVASPGRPLHGSDSRLAGPIAGACCHRISLLSHLTTPPHYLCTSLLPLCLQCSTTSEGSVFAFLGA